MPTTDWSETRRELTERLRALAVGEALILAESDPVVPDQPRRGLFRRRPRPVGGRYVQFMRLGDELLCECIGPKYAEIAPEAEQALLAQGWRAPGDPTVRSPNYEARLAFADPAAAADLGIDALITIGVVGDDLRWTAIPA